MFVELCRSEFKASTLDAQFSELKTAVESTIGERKELSSYAMDLHTGLALYEELGRRGFGVRAAADDGIWRYLSLVVFPELVKERCGVKEDWFWKARWRHWLKRTWWYVHLTWQGSREATLAAVGGMSTDTIAQLVERPGKAGFRPEVTRRIASGFVKNNKKMSEDSVRRLLKLNTAFLVTVEPAWSRGGVDGYVDRLYDALELKNGGRRGELAG